MKKQTRRPARKGTKGKPKPTEAVPATVSNTYVRRGIEGHAIGLESGGLGHSSLSFSMTRRPILDRWTFRF